MVNNQGAKIIGVGEGAPHDLCVGNAGLAIAECQGAGRLEETDLGHLIALQAFCHGGHRVDMDDCRIACAPFEIVDQCCIVDNRIGLRHADYGRDTACGSSPAGGCQRLAMLVTRLASEDHHIDQPRCDHMAGTVDDLGALRGIAAQMRPDIGNGFALDYEAAFGFRSACRIDQPRVDKGRGVWGPVFVRRVAHETQWFGRWRDSASRMAIRTATPISTCSAMTLR